MTTTIKKTPVKGGWVARSAKTGEFVAVGTGSTVSKKSPITESAIKEVSSRRRAALKRLADR